MPEIDVLNASHFPADLVNLIADAPRPGLDAHPFSAETSDKIPAAVASMGWVGSLPESGLWLLAGDLERSHTISQAHGSAEGSFWHGIMHRREGDYGNAKYWFHRVGNHPVHHELAERIAKHREEFHSKIPMERLLDVGSLANGLVDLCQKANRDQKSWVADLERIGWWEWQLLFAWTASSS